MGKLIQRIWQWLKKRLGHQPMPGETGKHRKHRTIDTASTLALSDTDYEFLLIQLLEGVAHGWHEGRILKFFQQLGDRGKVKPWLAWIERFSDKVLGSDSPNLMLAARLTRLGELTRSTSAVQPIGQAAYHLGRQLYEKESANVVWEYDGEDVDLLIQDLPLEPANTDQEKLIASDDAIPDETQSTTSTQENPIELTPEQLLEQLQQNPDLAAQLAEQLDLVGSPPQVLVEELIKQLQQAQQELQNQPEPQTVTDWFNRGLQQANVGDLVGAISSWDKALEMNPNLAQAWHNRASALGNLGQNQAAVESFDQALAINNDDFEAWNGKGNACYNLEQWEMAIACWDKALQLQPNFAQAWYNRGSALEKLSRIEEAIPSYQKSLEIAPDFELAKAKLELLSSNSPKEQ